MKAGPRPGRDADGRRRRISLGLDAEEALAVQAAFGVTPAQVRRDHAISHMLAGIAQSQVRDELVFFGGTALTRTYLADLRLSEDIDLIALRSRSQAATSLTTIFESALARTYGRVSWSPSLASTSGSEPANLVVGDGVAVQVQLLSDSGYSYPTKECRIERRYSDVPEIRLNTLTEDGFVVAKFAAWADRRAARDLYDLWALAKAGLVTRESMRLYERIGPTGARPRRSDLDDAPSEIEWEDALAHQCRIQVGPEEAAAELRHQLDAYRGE